VAAADDCRPDPWASSCMRLTLKRPPFSAMRTRSATVPTPQLLHHCTAVELDGLFQPFQDRRQSAC
jgi:hypothetical protein